ncbi:DNA/RNA non-specific endonuclease [uncultured Hymenobacter sp.]|uniref:DNA/RNA non-specific endonuclease n=1 Tax=uncultured Hymenobacter sp. TaxID=170016 RepID=UPI0035CA4942
MRPLLSLVSLLLLACTQTAPDTSTARPPAAGAPAGPAAAPAAAAAALLETFETGSKGAYTTAEEALATGRWRLVDALIGAAPQDHKRGLRAARLRGQGRLTMLFDAPAGVRRIRISSASYGQDAPSTWELWLSRDGGRRFERSGGPVTTQGPALVVRTFEGVAAEPLRLEIRKTDTGSGRLNVDDISLETAGGVATGPAAPLPAPAPTPAPTPPPAPNPPAPAERDDNLTLGNPSGATADPSNPTNYLLRRPQYVCGYNARRGTPTWTSWHLSGAWLGQAPRQDDFRPDPALPRSFYAVTPLSYRASGFDRGHCCPSGDRTTDLDDNSATFLMSNMLPQAPHNNQQTWAGLEEYTRAQVRRGQEVYVVMGAYGQGGTGSQGFAATLDEGRVTVPARIWKVLVILPEGHDDLRRLAAGGPAVRVLAVDTPNDQAVNPDWRQYLTSVDKIEAATGLDLLSALPLPAQESLQKLVDSGRAD